LNDASAESDPSGAGGERRVEILERRSAHQGFFSLDVVRLRHTLFAGGWSEPLTREVFTQRRAVAVLPYDPEGDRVVLVEQFRSGPLDVLAEPWLIEAPAGLVEPGESLEDVARRELREECGLGAGRLERAVSFFSTPGASSEKVTLFVAELLDEPKGGVHGLEDEAEDIFNHIVPAETAFGWVREGRVTGMTGVLGLLWLELHRDRLRRLWQRVRA
jgi:ADP-ribose pyrophosphatase